MRVHPALVTSICVAASLGAPTPAAAEVVVGNTPDTSGGNQAETVCTVGLMPDGSLAENVIYNDVEVQASMAFPPMSRVVSPGATLFGWSHRARTRADPDPSWTHNVLSPPTSGIADLGIPGVDVFWGDPGLATNPDLPSYVFADNLVMFDDKFQAYRTKQGTTAVQGGVGGDVTPVGGACVARSTDGGAHFSIIACFRDKMPLTASTNPDPLSNGTLGHFYDGSALAVAESPNGAGGSLFSVYASYHDIDAKLEGAWVMKDATAGRAPNLFQQDTMVGTLGTLNSCDTCTVDVDEHVRLRADGANVWHMTWTASTSTNPYATDVVGNLIVNIRERNASVVILAKDAMDGAMIALGNDSNGQPIVLRSGPDFAFDVGLNEALKPEMRFVYLSEQGYLQGGWCTGGDPNTEAFTDCETPTEWRWMVTSLFPAIRYARTKSGTVDWKVTFVAANTSFTQVAVGAVDLQRDASGNAEYVSPKTVTPFQTPCPDTRIIVPGTPAPPGYWGDYDSMDYDPASESFVRTYTDSTAGACQRDTFTSQPVHVSMVTIPALGHLVNPPPQVTVALTGEQFGTTGFTVCTGGSDLHGLPDTTVVCALKQSASGGFVSNTFQQELSCDSGRGAFVVVTCAPTESIAPTPGVDVTVGLSLENSCGDNSPVDTQTFTATDVLPGAPQSNPQPLISCDFFGENCWGVANGGACSFNSFNASVTVTNTTSTFDF